MDRSVFSIFQSTGASGYRNYGAIFVDEIKNVGTAEAFKNSRFVV